ncbi:MAG: PIG-L family deacetylase [Candidatus Dormibacteraeota bacterium]|nr:PIG-L family deacetylase [Candidatus Dormibacteraeota bacterium]
MAEQATRGGLDWLPERVLCVCAHPDDTEFGFAATVARLTAEGAEVTYVVVTDGSQGGEDPSVPDADLVAVRQAEQRAAAAVLGVREVRFLGLADGWLTADVPLRRLIVREIRRARPQLVLTQSPSRALVSGRIGVDHPDHLAVGEATLQAVYPDARNPRAFRDLLQEGLEPVRVEEVWIAAPQGGDHLVDVSDFVDKKLEALACHQSQITKVGPARPAHPWSELEPSIRRRLAAQGEPAGYAAAEGFRRLVTR